MFKFQKALDLRSQVLPFKVIEMQAARKNSRCDRFLTTMEWKPNHVFVKEGG